MSERTLRYSTLLPINTIKNTRAHVIGVGAIGSAVAALLCSMGVGKITIYDPDEVSPENLGPQGYNETDVGLPKVEALAIRLNGLNPECDIEAYHDRFQPGEHIIEEGDLVICCVDTMSARSMIFENAERNWSLWIDVRMGPEIMRVLTVRPNSDAIEAYLATIFPDDEAAPQVCTARSTNYCATACACIAVAQWARSLRPTLVHFPDLTFNMLTMDFMPGECILPPAELFECAVPAES